MLRGVIALKSWVCLIFVSPHPAEKSDEQIWMDFLICQRILHWQTCGQNRQKMVVKIQNIPGHFSKSVINQIFPKKYAVFSQLHFAGNVTSKICPAKKWFLLLVMLPANNILKISLGKIQFFTGHILLVMLPAKMTWQICW